MKVKYLGHACFIITSDKGTKIITDPYQTGGGLRYGEIRETADIVTVSHNHFDHSNVAAVRGNPRVVKGVASAEVKGIRFTGVSCFHDEAAGKKRGSDTIFCFEVDGISVCHLGDLGHKLSDKQVAEIGRVDILLVPVGGYYTIDAKVATEICAQLKPKVIIPMHYKTEKGLPLLASAEDFLKGKANVSRLGSSEVEFKPGALPAATQIVVLKTEL